MRVVTATFSGLLLGTALAATAQVRLDPPEPQLGERARLRLESAPSDSTLLPTGRDVVLRATGDPRVFEVIPVRVGDVEVAVPTTGDTLRWSVRPRLAEAAPDSLRPWWSVGDLGPNWWPSLLIVAALLAPLLWWLSRRRRAEAPVAPEPVEPPHVVALRRLDEIAAAGWVAQGRFEEFYVEASHALRSYVAGRFRVPALDWTTGETLERLVAVGHEKATVTGIDPLLRAADAVKFAARRPSEHQAEQWLVEARRWIEETAFEPVYSTPEALAAAAALRPASSTVEEGR